MIYIDTKETKTPAVKATLVSVGEIWVKIFISASSRKRFRHTSAQLLFMTPVSWNRRETRNSSRVITHHMITSLRSGANSTSEEPSLWIENCNELKAMSLYVGGCSINHSGFHTSSQYVSKKVIFQKIFPFNSHSNVFSQIHVFFNFSPAEWC